MAFHSPGGSHSHAPSPISPSTPQRTIESPSRGGQIHFDGPHSPSPFRSRPRQLVAQQPVDGSDASTVSGGVGGAGDLSVSVFSEADNMPVGSGHSSPAFPIQRILVAGGDSRPRELSTPPRELSQVEEGLMSPASGSPGTHHSSSSRSSGQSASQQEGATAGASAPAPHAQSVTAVLDTSLSSVHSTDEAATAAPARGHTPPQEAPVSGTDDSSTNSANHSSEHLPQPPLPQDGDAQSVHEEDLQSQHSSPGHRAAPAPPSPVQNAVPSPGRLGSGFTLGVPSAGSAGSLQARGAAPTVGGGLRPGHSWSTPTAQGFGAGFSGSSQLGAARPSTLADVLAEEVAPEPSSTGGSPTPAAGPYQVAAMRPWMRNSDDDKQAKTPPSLPRSSRGPPDSAGLVQEHQRSTEATARQAAADLGFEDTAQDSGTDTESDEDSATEGSGDDVDDLGAFDDLL